MTPSKEKYEKILQAKKNASAFEENQQFNLTD